MDFRQEAQDLVDENERLQARIADLEAERDRYREALDGLLGLTCACSDAACESAYDQARRTLAGEV